MTAQADVELGSLAVDGGAAANDLLCQLQSDALGVRVDRSAQLQTTGLGAAFLAGLGCGLWHSLDDLRQTRQSSHVFTPTPDGRLDRTRWRAAVERCRGWASAEVV